MHEIVMDREPTLENLSRELGKAHRAFRALTAYALDRECSDGPMAARDAVEHSERAGVLLCCVTNSTDDLDDIGRILDECGITEAQALGYFDAHDHDHDEDDVEDEHVEDEQDLESN